MSFLPPNGESSRREPVRSRAELREVAQESRRGLGRSLGLTALGTLLPGLGLSLTRRRWLGIPLVLLALLGLGLGGWYVARHGALASALDLAARPRLLRGVAVALVAGGLVWIASIVLTAVTARPRSMSGLHRGALAVFTALMCLVVAAPVAVGLRYIDAHTDAADRIFTGTSRTAEDGSVDPAAPNLEEEDPWAHVPRVNVLLLGTDAADEREGVRTDSMIVASIDTQTGDTVLFGIPRNLQNVPIPASNPLSMTHPQGFDCGSECLMNGIWTAAEELAEQHPEWYADDPNPGLTATREVIAAVIGQPISYTLIVNLEGFRDLVDAMGGVHINVQERLPMGGRSFEDERGRLILIEGSESGWLEVGPQLLSGREALWYARSRVTSDDFSRMRRQRCVVAALVQQVNPITMLQRYPEIAAVAGENISVDIAPEELPAWADLVQRVQRGSIQSLPFTQDNTVVWDPDFAWIRLTVHQALHPVAPATPTGMATAAPEQTDGPPATDSPTTQDPEPEVTGPDDATTDPAERPADELTDVGAVC